MDDTFNVPMTGLAEALRNVIGLLFVEFISFDRCHFVLVRLDEDYFACVGVGTLVLQPKRLAKNDGFRTT